MLMTVMTMTIVILMALYVVKNMLVCSGFMEYLQLMYVCTYIHIHKFVLFLYFTFNFLPEVSITRMAKKIHHEEEFIIFLYPTICQWSKWHLSFSWMCWSCFVSSHRVLSCLAPPNIYYSTVNINKIK